MIPEYKLYHGAVLAELVQRLARPVEIDELSEPGRLSAYMVDRRLGFQVKHSAQRMNPWPFTFTRQNLSELARLNAVCVVTFVVFVCHTDGMVCLTLNELESIMEVGEAEQAWVRVDRRKRQWYSISGGKGELPGKKPRGLDLLIGGLEASSSDTEPSHESTIQKTGWSPFSFFSRGKGP